MTRAEQSDADGILPVAIGTAAWTVALVVLLALRERLDEAGRPLFPDVLFSGSMR